MKMIVKFLVSLLVVPFWLASAHAEEMPDVMIKQVTEDVLTVVRQDSAIQGGDTSKAIALVEEKVLPHFDFERMTALAMGRDWRKANDEQKKQLTQEFKTLLVRTYSNALTEYRDQVVQYKPLKAAVGADDVEVETQVVKAGSKPIGLNYSVAKVNGSWKVYDVVVAGVSLVTNYRATFNQQVKSQGVDGLINMLVQKNNQMKGAAAQ